MAFRPTPQAIERARQSIEVAGVFKDNAPAVARSCAEASPGEIVIAVTDPAARFDGVFICPLSRLYESVMGQEPGAWTLVFSPGDTLAEIELRCHKMARYAEARYELSLRIASR